MKTRWEVIRDTALFVAMFLAALVVIAAVWLREYYLWQHILK